MTNADYIKISASLAAMDNKEFQCSSCVKKYAKSPQQFEFKACREKKEHVKIRIGKDLLFSRCPGNFVAQEVYGWVRAVDHMEHGILPYAGGLMDQPAKAVEVMNLIHSHRIEKQIEEMNRARKNKAVTRGR